MNFHQMLVNGAKIEIKPHLEHMKCFDSATFWYENNLLYTRNVNLGTFPRTSEEYSVSEFNKHIEKMVKEHFQVIITG